jgi:adenine-specific DNA-methyltransferase
MNSRKPKLELTWIGKDEELKLEPRILIEDPKRSYGDPKSENMLIHGDNLLALKALEQDFTEKIKCIYIDPPYNTGARIDADGKEVGYDDGLEHSEWLKMMKPRLELLKVLLREDGTLIVQIDDNEYARLYLLLAEVFLERNLKTICVKMSEATGVKMAHVINKGRIPKLKEYLIIARKDGIKDLFVEKIPKVKWDDEYKHVVRGVTMKEVAELKDIIEDEERYQEEDITRADEICGKMYLDSLENLFIEFNANTEEGKLNLKFENAWRIVRDVATSDTAKSEADIKRKIVRGNFFTIVTPQKKKYVIRKDYNPAASQPRIKLLFADDYLTIHPGDFWQDIKTTGLDNEGGVDFRKGKKPEALLKRAVGMASNEGDWVLDSFAGSGTTGGVSHKMGRRWIMVELANHCFTHIIPRLKGVCDGSDTQGISKSVNWKGGGGFKFYELAPSLLRKDKFGNFVIDEKYNANMLAAAMCKHENFKFFPDAAIYWKQGKSTETDYIFVTTSFITVEQMDKIHEEMKSSESLLICAKAFAPGCKERHNNITIKKIPQMVLGKCEFGKNNYDLNIIKVTEESEEDE